MGTNLHRNTTGGKGETACKKTSPEQQEQERRRRKKKKKEKKRKKKKNIIIIFIIIISLYNKKQDTQVKEASSTISVCVIKGRPCTYFARTHNS